ncbi:MAG: hypothetical protein GX638_01180, partial [Crenarchaeota archaeon]|nr:hypothetical protein [Thermoproteota archaeon]
MLNALALSANKKTNEDSSLLSWARANVHKRKYIEANLPVRTLQFIPKNSLKSCHLLETN